MHFFSAFAGRVARTAWLLVLLLGAAAGGPAGAQTTPPTPPANLQGQALRDWLRQNWYDPYRQVLSYADARGRMYNYADNYNNQVVCVYSGYSENVPFSQTSTNTGVVARINCEHTVPQSWFNQTVRMRSDMHHLFPTYDTWNNNRGSDPFAEIPDAQTLLWMRGTQSQTTIPTANIAEYSEDTNTQFEPREDHKGNLARAVFYFYTMHAGQPDLVATGHNNISSVADLNTLYQWHLADPVDAHETERNRRVAVSQGNFNPYISDPALVARAWGFATGPVVSFASAAGSVAEGNSGTTTYAATLNVSPAPTAALTVQVALDAANSTATSGSDFAFASPTTVTFAAGQTSQTVAVTVNGDTQPEADETVVLALQNPGTGASLGGPSTHTLTITNDDGAPPAVAFAAATGSVAEGNSGTTAYTVAVQATGLAAGAGSFTVPVAVDAAGTTASSPADYTLNTTTLTFNGNGSQTVTVTVVGDLTPEPNETVRLRLGAPSTNGVIVGAPSTHTLTILNDDQPPTGATCTDPYFSKYIESLTGNTKVLEIFNPTNAPLSLSGLRVDLFANGATTPTFSQSLTGTVAPYDVYVIANTGVTDAGVRAQTDLQSSVAFFNGDDALALFDGTDTLDVIGVIGQQPAAGGWPVLGSNPAATTKDNSLMRNPAVGRGSTRWGATSGIAPWTAQGADNYTGVGSYASTACARLAAQPAVVRGGLEIYPNPAGETARLRLPGATAARLATVDVLDPVGRVVRSRPGATVGAAETVLLDLRGLAPGVYAVRVSAGAGQPAYTGRLVIN